MWCSNATFPQKVCFSIAFAMVRLPTPGQLSRKERAWWDFSIGDAFAMVLFSYLTYPQKVSQLVLIRRRLGKEKSFDRERKIIDPQNKYLLILIWFGDAWRLCQVAKSHWTSELAQDTINIVIEGEKRPGVVFKYAFSSDGKAREIYQSISRPSHLLNALAKRHKTNTPIHYAATMQPRLCQIVPIPFQHLRHPSWLSSACRRWGNPYYYKWPHNACFPGIADIVSTVCWTWPQGPRLSLEFWCTAPPL